MAHQSIWNNPKAMRLATEVGEPLPHVVGHLDSLWTASYDHCLPDGAVFPEDVESLAKWDGPPGKLLESMKTTGFLDEVSGKSRKLMIHQWCRYIPDYVRKRIDRQYVTPARLSGQNPDKIRLLQAKGGQGRPREANTTDNAVSPNEFLATWNGMGTPFPEARAMTGKRLVLFRACRADTFWRENWRTALERVKASPFCRGEEGNSGWIANLDWFLRPDSVVRTMEGRYNKRTVAVPKSIRDLQAQASIQRFIEHKKAKGELIDETPDLPEPPATPEAPW